jgi:hypothetical protein
MPQKLTDTATLQCDQGTTHSKLVVTSQDFCKAEGQTYCHRTGQTA